MKTVIKVILAVLIVSISFDDVRAVDPHFSQYNASPLVLNPGMTGVFNGNYRFTAIYRSQWNSVLKNESVPMYRTFAGSYDMRFNMPGNNDAVGVGLAILTDKAGEAEFGTNAVNLSLSYLKALNREGSHFLTLGFQGGLAQRTINFSKLQFGNQFDGEGFNINLASGETFDNDNFLFFDVGAGVFWYYMQKKRTNYYAGVSVAHINRADQSFYENDESRLYIKTTGTAGLQVPIGNQVDLLPSVLVMSQGPAIETMIGSYIKLLFEAHSPQGNAFYIGPWYRITRRIIGENSNETRIGSEALVLATRFDYGSFSIGFSYDINFSDLTPASNSRGGFEVSAVHVGSFKQKSKVKFCPRF